MAPIMAKAGFHLRQLPFHTFSLLETPKLLSQFQYPSIFVPNHHHRQFLLLFSSWNLHICKCYKADEFNFGAEDDDTEDFDDSLEQWFDVLDDYFDSIWIFKVFGSFGWSLPFILSSMLLVTGPKAFLMALALPIGQSTLAFAVQKLQNWGKVKLNLKNKTKRRKSRAYSSRKGNFEQNAEWIDSKGPRKRKKRCRTSRTRKDVSIGGSHSGATKFGGWDELDAAAESMFGSSVKVGQESNEMRGGHEVKGEAVHSSIIKAMGSGRNSGFFAPAAIHPSSHTQRHRPSLSPDGFRRLRESKYGGHPVEHPPERTNLNRWKCSAPNRRTLSDVSSVPHRSPTQPSNHQKSPPPLSRRPSPATSTSSQKLRRNSAQIRHHVRRHRRSLHVRRLSRGGVEMTLSETSAKMNDGLWLQVD
ncbi:Unknown protein [Striga hermonthica]|uniref:Uncharacterized protein n=1 Tax=Striga hermonthica TaxID=68872 RepID=A0A9N7MZ41_STRHE|nr:Unknown protein [Striga hermonthica]